MSDVREELIQGRIGHLEISLRDERWARAEMDKVLEMKITEQRKFMEYVGAAIFVVALAWAIRHLLFG